MESNDRPPKYFVALFASLAVTAISWAIVGFPFAEADVRVNYYLLALVLGVSALVYWTYKKYVNYLRRIVAREKNVYLRRAKRAENHVALLEHHVTELEETSQDLRLSREKFRHAAYHDSLTGLPNRNFFIDSLREVISQSSDGTGKRFAVLFLDLNRFKTINESLGHSFGDEVIKQVANRLYGQITTDDVVGRFSGDEFAVLRKNVTSTEAAVQFAGRVAKHISEPILVQGRNIFASVSIGIAFDNSTYAEAEEIIRDAEIAMYCAKEIESPYVIFDQKMHARAVNLHDLQTDLRYAIEKDELELFYQPIVALKDLKLVGFEALVRWNHPTRGLIPPSEFIALSEDTGLIVPMTVKLLAKACCELSEWRHRSASGRPLTVSVNISGKHFAEGDLLSHIKRILAETEIDPSLLRLEITESAVMKNAEHAISVLTKIRETGIRISIDDFGTGYSSLSYLQRFPIDVLKIDRSFVSTMEDASGNGEIVRTILALASALNLDVVAEGIESIHQLHQLRVLECEYGQGYLFSRPLPARGVYRLINDNMRWQGIGPAASMPIVPRDRDYTDLPFAQ